MAQVAPQLPPELLLECFQVADLPTCVRASHISRAWRCLALSDSCLWDSFSCTEFRDLQHQDAMFSQLQVMLQRSRSLPFRLRIPHRYRGNVFEYQRRLIAILELDVRRIASYNGPDFILAALIVGRTPLLTLTSLDLIEPHLEYDLALFDLQGAFSAPSFPNLRRLEAPFVAFYPDSGSFPAVRHLTCSLDNDQNLVRLLEVFPNLVHDIEPTMRFPRVSLPSSLQTIVLSPVYESELNPFTVLQFWDGIRIPRFVARNANTLRGVLQLFLAIHAHPVIIRLNGANGEIQLCAAPGNTSSESTWTITPSRASHATFLQGLDARDCERLTSISVSLEQLGRLFAAQLHVPALDSLDFRLDGSQELPLLQAGDDGFVIRAPRLQHVSFIMDRRADAVPARTDEVQSVLVVLSVSFRSLIVYDADLLQTVTFSVPADCVQKLNCAEFAVIAKDYRVCVSAEVRPVTCLCPLVVFVVSLLALASHAAPNRVSLVSYSLYPAHAM